MYVLCESLRSMCQVHITQLQKESNTNFLELRELVFQLLPFFKLSFFVLHVLISVLYTHWGLYIYIHALLSVFYTHWGLYIKYVWDREKWIFVFVPVCFTSFFVCIQVSHYLTLSLYGRIWILLIKVLHDCIVDSLEYLTCFLLFDFWDPDHYLGLLEPFLITYQTRYFVFYLC